MEPRAKKQKTSSIVHWINLREEPLIYINGKPFVLRDEHASFRNLTTFSGITPDRLEDLEKRLKQDVLAEALEYKGKILLHGEVDAGEIVGVWEAVDESSVQTPREIYESLMAQGYNVAYHRIPITAGEPPEPNDFDALFRVICQANSQQDSFVFNCQMGRSTIGQVIALLVLDWLGKNLLVTTNETNLFSSQYEVVISLLRVIRTALETKRKVDLAVDKAASFINLREIISESNQEAQVESEGAEKKKRLRKSINLLKRYFWLIVFGAYLHETVPDSIREQESFLTWVQCRLEIQTMLKKMEEDHAAALQPIHDIRATMGNALDEEVALALDTRSGEVLAKHTILKSDHFPGCQKLSLKDRIDGAPNFRQVVAKELGSSKKYSIVGVAIPIKSSIRLLLEKMGENRNILWTNMREEPVLYLKGKPFVLRNLRNPLNNIEATGITRERVEMMENRMKQDVLTEIAKNNGLVLLHDEDQSFGLRPYWETLTPEDVQTSLEVFQGEGHGKIQFLRVPITDEQAPIPEVFDIIHERAKLANDNTDLFFNCQMGRGRTTTGMIISSITEITASYLSGKYLLKSNLSHGTHDRSISVTKDQKERYLQGEYKLILSLLRVLKEGKISKAIADESIDKFAHVQNLREAVYDMKIRYEALDQNSPLKNEHYVRAVNYLIRYFYFIVFAAFLLEKPTSSFREWLVQRPEISYLLADAKNDFSN